ncbi:hypothetical protein D1AOALGA4SA_7684 [Olavius algarvensis Delta 1 endosymbiont]|nr:hypothetical protein D1AOALGA4SA_7684 [Olavius algarvensis Delta 1 endosymbiont]
MFQQDYRHCSLKLILGGSQIKMGLEHQPHLDLILYGGPIHQ